MLFNKNLIKKYKNIEKTCIKDTYLIPYLIKEFDVPLKHCLSINEKRRLYGKYTDKQKEKLNNQLRNRRQTEILILKHKHETYNTIYEYHLDELNIFLKKYPKYNTIIN